MSKLKEKGITLVALVVTIIILLILAGVTISQIGGNNGLFSKVKQAVGQYKNASLDEEGSLKEIEKHLSEFEILGGDKTDEGVKVTIKNFEANPEGKNIKVVVTIEGTASKIEYSLDGETWVRDEENETNTEYIFKEVKIGSYNVRVRVYDEEGKKTEAMKQVIIVDTDIEIAKEGEVLKGKKYYDGEREEHTGTMENRGDLNIIVPEEGITLDPGYYEGGTITSEKGYDKGGLDLELLWENENPDAKFVAQTINTIDLSKYKIIAIRTHYKADNNPNCNFSMCFIKVNSTGFISVSGTYKNPSSNNDVWPWYGYRYVTINGNNIIFGGGYFNGSSAGPNDAYAIPLEIYGLIEEKEEWF